MTETAQRLREAAFELFEQEGYDATTVDDIADRAGLGRSTFFRHFRSKEDVIFPDHSDVVTRVRDRLAAAGPADTPSAVTDAARIVLRRYVDEGELARSRYRLTRTIPLLRAREIAHMQQYQREFREFVRAWTGEPPGADLRAELLASAIVVAHNQVLRRWLRGESDSPEAELDEAMALVTSIHAPDAGDTGATVLVVRSRRDADTVAAAVRRALRE
ncbi:MAG TPA: TetR family transcriptional regulator [Nocardioides sp.]|nr:TetR family transcriptional regulator [Nocardioides sp.]